MISFALIGLILLINKRFDRNPAGSDFIKDSIETCKWVWGKNCGFSFLKDLLVEVLLLSPLSPSYGEDYDSLFHVKVSLLASDKIPEVPKRTETSKEE